MLEIFITYRMLLSELENKYCDVVGRLRQYQAGP